MTEKTEADWDKDLRQKRAAVDRAQQRMEEVMLAAHLGGRPYRWIADRVRLNHETVRTITTRLKEEAGIGEPAAAQREAGQ